MRVSSRQLLPVVTTNNHANVSPSPIPLTFFLTFFSNFLSNSFLSVPFGVEMEDDKRRAYICQQAAMQAKKKQEEGVPPKGTGPLNSFIKRKTTDKVDRPTKKPKVVTGSTIRETPPTTKLPPPSCPEKGKGLITAKGPVSKKRPTLLCKDSWYAIG